MGSLTNNGKACERVSEGAGEGVGEGADKLARNFFAELGSKGVDEDALLLWLKDTTTGDKINEMMLNVRNGGSITEPTERSTVGSSDQTFCYSSKCI